MAWGWGSWIGGRSRCGTNREQFIINQTSAYYTTAGSFIECPKTHFVPASTKDSLCPIRTCILGRKLKTTHELSGTRIRFERAMVGDGHRMHDAGRDVRFCAHCRVKSSTYRHGSGPLTCNHEQKAFQQFNFWNPIHILQEDLCKDCLEPGGGRESPGPCFHV